ncbi:EAL domain-containing protein [Lutibacter sp. B2]|nr:EAL domain-containing protein [Lutibacter sp. B2]
MELEDVKLSRKNLLPIKISLIYGFVGCLWILFSDELLNRLVKDIVLQNRIQLFKGWIYVIVTACMIYIIIKSDLSKIDTYKRQLYRQRKLVEDKSNYFSDYDTITGLPNRGLFSNYVSNALKDTKDDRKLAILVFDIDRFKAINETLGHVMGDEVIKLITKRISDMMEEKHIFGRIGGDEFGILLTQIEDEKYVEEFAKKIINSFKKSFILEGYELYITASIGVSIYPYDGDDLETLIKCADMAMYRVKDIGRNNYAFYTKELNRNSLENLKIATDLRYAIEREEFVVYYQPKVDINKDEVMGMEALIRWKHPQLGMISPVKFIPIAEETGLIIPIGEWVLKTACIQNKQWQEDGYEPIRVSVNLSACQFRQKNIVERIVNILDEIKLDPKYLELEITESTAVIDMDYTLKILNELKKLGIYIAMDDFGTGYSSLNYLKNMTLDELKIDKSFIQDCLLNKNNENIVNVIISLAHNLNLKVTAEGVETIEQLEFLKEKKCDKMQGYLFSPPVAREEFEIIIKNNKSVSS